LIQDNMKTTFFFLKPSFVQKVVHSIIVIFPSFLLLILHGGSMLYLAMILISIFCAFNLKSFRKISKIEIYYIILILLFLFSTTFSYLINNPSLDGLSSLEDSIKFCSLSILFILLIKISIDTELLFVSFILNALLIGIYALVNDFFLPIDERLTGVKGPMSFGYLTLTIAFLSLASSIYWLNNKKIKSILGFFGFLLCIQASFLTQTRGAWIALPILILIYVFYITKNKKIKMSTVIILLSISVPILTYINFDIIKNRTMVAYKETISFIQHQKSERGSVHDRLSMWTASWHLFKQKPIFGSGLTCYSNQIKDICIKKNINTYITKYDNPHSTYLNQLITRGLFGLTVYIFILATPLYFSLKKIKSKECKERVTALAIATITAGYTHFSLTYPILEKSTTILFFSFYIPILISHSITLQSKKRGHENFI